MLRHYVGVLRRRWYWIVLGLAVGLIGGFVSTLFVSTHHDRATYYKATNTLLANSSPTSSGSGGDTSSTGTNLQQAAFLVRLVAGGRHGGQEAAPVATR